MSDLTVTKDGLELAGETINGFSLHQSDYIKLWVHVGLIYKNVEMMDYPFYCIAD